MPECKHCKKPCPKKELSTSLNLCLSCRKSFPLVFCKYCKAEFHVKNGTDEDNVACVECKMNAQLYGEPSDCVYCTLPSAFAGQPCRRCCSSEKKHGKPVTCERCTKKSAFIKDAQRRRKVNGKILCMLCTMEYKRELHREKKRLAKEKDSDADVDTESQSKKPKLGGFEKESTESADKGPLGCLFPIGNISKVTQLNAEVAEMKKLLHQKDQELFKKDKQIFELRAQLNEMDKTTRQKTFSLQKEHKERSEVLLMQIRTLQKQSGKKAKV